MESVRKIILQEKPIYEYQFKRGKTFTDFMCADPEDPQEGLSVSSATIFHKVL